MHSDVKAASSSTALNDRRLCAVRVNAEDDGRTHEAVGTPILSVLWAGIVRNKRITASSGALLVLFVSAGIAYVTQLVTARVLGAEKFGVFAYVLAWITTLSYVATLGFNVSLLRFISAYRATGQWGLLRGVLSSAQRSTAVLAVSMVALGSATITLLGSRLPIETSQTFQIGLCAVPVVALHLVSAAAVRAFDSVVGALWPEKILRDCAALAVIVVISLTGLRACDSTMAMLAFLTGSLVTLATLRIMLFRLRAKAGIDARPEYAHAEWLRPVPALTLMMILDNLTSRSGVILLGLHGQTINAGIFAAASAMALLTALPRMAVASMFAPSASAFFARNDHAGLQALVAKAAALSIAGTLVVAAPLLLFARSLLAWFGPGFEVGAPVLMILVAGYVFAAACGPQQHILTMTGNERTGAALYTASALTNVLGCLALMNSFGMYGAAAAMSLSLVGWNIAMAVKIQRQMALRPGLLVLARQPKRTDRMSDAWADSITRASKARSK